MAVLDPSLLLFTYVIGHHDSSHRIIFVYGFVKLLVYILANRMSSVCRITSAMLTRNVYDMAIPSESKQNQRDASRKKSEKINLIRVMPVSLSCHV